MTPVPSENLIHLDSQREPESSSSSSMLAILRLLVMFIADIFKSQRRLEAENLFLRHQLNIAMRRAPPRLRLYGSDRALLVWMTRIWPGLLDVSRVAKPETILRWHRSGFKAFWRWKSGNRAGRLKACSSGVGSHYPTTRWRCFRGSRDDGALRGRDANEIERARIIHDGQELKVSINRPDTEAQDQPSPNHHFRLATRGRSIQMGQQRTLARCKIRLSGPTTKD